MAVTIHYDGDCPFCERYVRLLRLRRAAGPVRLVDLRENADIRGDLADDGFDPDRGMIVETGNRRLGGADAVNALALLSTPSDRFNRANRLLLSSPPIAAAVYPVLRSGRWLTLFLLGRQRIAAEDSGLAARAEIFGCFFALFSIFHFFNYALEYNRFPPQWDQVALLLSAILLLFKPGSARVLWLVMLASTISTVVQAPVHSNHTMVRSAVLVGYWASFLFAMARGAGWSAIFANFTLAGRGVLLVMYVFGIFHKINADFLDPATSCAVALWQQMPEPLSRLDGPLVHHATIYGTFAAEGAIALMLLTPRLRHWGVVGGILFHLLIALSDYAMYISFTMLSIALHALFLSDGGAGRIVASRGMRMLRVRRFDPVYGVVGLLLVAGLVLAAAAEEYSLVTVLALPLVLPLVLLVVRHGRSTQPRPSHSRPRSDRPAIVIGAVATALFFANCAMPYLGLKSAQAVNMFSNLRLEGGVSNHLILPHPPGPFGYLEDVAVIESSGGDGRLEWYRRGFHPRPQAVAGQAFDDGRRLEPRGGSDVPGESYAIVYYDLLGHLQKNPEVVVTFKRGGQRFEQVSAAGLANDMTEKLHPAWFRKWFHFQPVALQQPESCNV